MKYLKMLGLAAVAAMAMTAFTAGSASATTLEVGGVTQNSAVLIEASLGSGTSLTWSRTDGSFGNTCTAAHIAAITDTFTGSSLTGPKGLGFAGCTRPVVVHKSGTLHVAHSGGTDGTVSSSGTEVTVGTAAGTINCKTGGGVDIGTLTGTGSGHATLHINAVISCGFLAPSFTWKGTYVLTTPTGLGVSA